MCYVQLMAILNSKDPETQYEPLVKYGFLIYIQ